MVDDGYSAISHSVQPYMYTIKYLDHDLMLVSVKVNSIYGAIPQSLTEKIKDKLTL